MKNERRRRDGLRGWGSRLIVVTLALMALAAQRGTATAPDDETAFSAAYLRYLALVQTSMTDDARRELIGDLESVLRHGEPHDVGRYHLMEAIGNLSSAIGEEGRAESLRREILVAPEAAPDLRATAGLRILSAMQSRAEPSLKLAIAEILEEVLEPEFLGQHAAAFDFDRALLPARKASWIAERLEHEAQTETAGQRSDASPAESYDAIVSNLTRFLANWHQLSDTDRDKLRGLNWGDDAARVMLGEASMKLGLIRGRHDQRHEWDTARTILTEVIDSTTASEHFSQAAAVLLLQMNEKDNGASERYVDFATSLVAKVKGGHEHAVTNELNDAAMRLSRSDRAVGNAVFDLLLGQERRWFPTDYQTHINYQVGMIESIAGLYDSGEREKAAMRLDELRHLPITDAVLEQRVRDVSTTLSAMNDDVAAVPSPTTSGTVLFRLNMIAVAMFSVVLVVRALRARGQRRA